MHPTLPLWIQLQLPLSVGQLHWLTRLSFLFLFSPWLQRAKLLILFSYGQLSWLAHTRPVSCFIVYFCLYFPFHTCLTAPPSIGSHSNMPVDSLLFPCVLVKCVWLFGRCIFLIYTNSHLSFMSIFLYLSLHTVGLFLAPCLLLCSHLFLFITFDVIHSPRMGTQNAPNSPPPHTTLGWTSSYVLPHGPGKDSKRVYVPSSRIAGRVWTGLIEKYWNSSALVGK